MIAGVGVRVGEMGEDGQQIQTSSDPVNKSCVNKGRMCHTATLVDSMLHILKLQRE